jgi:PTH1 family peptidyl-tRNA hydrolase
MPWLQKRPQFNKPSLIYSIGLNKTILIVGLGNIGKEYQNTRHNIGFNCIDKFVSDTESFSGWINKKDFNCYFNSTQIADKKVIAIKPTTLMNNSGFAVSSVIRFYKIETSNIVVIHDDLDINFGQIRTRIGGSSAGHNGIKSITDSINTEEYGRIRIGIGPKKPQKIDSKDFVLARFTSAEQKHLLNLNKEVNVLLTEYIYGTGQLSSETRSFII